MVFGPAHLPNVSSTGSLISLYLLYLNVKLISSSSSWCIWKGPSGRLKLFLYCSCKILPIAHGSVTISDPTDNGPTEAHVFLFV